MKEKDMRSERIRKEKFKANIIADAALVAALLVIFVAGVLLGTKFAPRAKEIYRESEESVTIKVPAINSSGEGVMTELTAVLKRGNGQILVNVNDVIAGYELQLSARNAVHAVQNITGINMMNYDVSYSIKTDASLIEGSSASAAMAVAVLSLLQKKPLDPKVTITGAIETDGRIAGVGMVEKKAEAAKRANMSLLLVPLGQGRVIEQTEEQRCVSNGYDYCEVRYMPKIVKRGFGIMVKEVANLNDAIREFTSFNETIEQNEPEIRVENRNKEPNMSIEKLGIKELSLNNYSIAKIELTANSIVLKSDCTALSIGTTEEQIESIDRGMRSVIVGRPNAHDLFVSSLKVFGIEVIGVTVDSYEANTYKGHTIAVGNKKVLNIDSRPSDAIAIAVRFNAPVYVSNALFESYGEKIC